MSTKKSEKIQSRLRRKGHIRKHINGTAERPRLAVYRSLSHIYAQLIDDQSEKSIISVSDLSPDIKASIKKGTTKTDKSVMVGELIAKKAIEKKIINVVFDRGGFKYHGRIKALADAARKAGLEF
ncbi:50S ribosomal protein L18 [bacterium]|nr:50S ribosomal protein L18 [bacterium]MBU1063312.1 50S ribosomal protein L18 [bacterium]MBU1634783.1 50S ribosomal protein L18 [bacterium]MBU1874048.1 50S ribosomal protein L18 [bacterium]